MAARLLAYGGTEHRERTKVGRWSISSEVLSSLAGLDPHVISFGLGIDNGLAFLIFRERRNLENRGGYPFGLLFDPGDVIWQSFRWSAADLLLALQTTEGGRALLDNPEQFDGPALDTFASSLEPPQHSSAEAPVSRLSLILCQSLDEARTIALKPDQLLSDPTPSAISLSLPVFDASLPVFASTGFGWLIRGTFDDGVAVNARVVVDFERRSDFHSTEELVGRGQQRLREWTLVSKQYNSALASYHCSPPWLWDASPKIIFANVNLLTRLYKPGEDDTILDEAIEVIRENGPLSEAVGAAAREYAVAGTGKITRRSSVYLAEYYANLNQSMDATLIRRVDESWLVDEMVRRETPPKKVDWAEVPADLLLRAWINVLEKADPAQRGPLLVDALKQLDGIAGNLKQNDFDHLAETSLCNVDFEQLEPWADLRKDLRVGKIVQKHASSYLRNHQSKFSARAYLLFRDDPDCSELYHTLQKTNEASVAAQFIDKCLDELGGKYSRDAESLLANIAASPFRKLLPIRTKVHIADLVGTVDVFAGPWGRLRLLEELFFGRSPEGDFDLAPEVEQDYLRQELDDLFGGNQVTTPDLLGLKKLLGFIRPKSLACIERLQPDFICQERRLQWIEGLEALGLREAARNAGFAAFIRHGMPIPRRDDDPRSGSGTELLEASIRDAFLVDFDRGWINEILQAAIGQESLTASIASVFAHVEPTERALLGERLRDDLGLLNSLALVHSPTVRAVLSWVVAFEPDYLVSRFRKALIAAHRHVSAGVIDAGSIFPLYIALHRAVVDYLLANKTLCEAVALKLLPRSEKKNFEAYLRQILSCLEST